MNIDFEHIMHTAKNQTGYHFPTEGSVRDQLYQGEAAREVHKAACIVQFQNPDHVVSDDDPGHYAIETVIVEACVALYQKYIDYHNLR